MALTRASASEGTPNGRSGDATGDADRHCRVSRASFEKPFPRLTSGGKRVIEDRARAHGPVTTCDTAGGRALSSPILGLAMAVASNPRIFSRLEVRPGLAIVTGGEATLPARPTLDSLIQTAPRVRQPLHLPA